jgi:hypothetical protein
MAEDGGGRLEGGGGNAVRGTIPTDLLMRLLQATPEQYAAIEGILGGNGDGRMKKCARRCRMTWPGRFLRLSANSSIVSVPTCVIRIGKIVIGEGEIDMTFSCLPTSEEQCKNQQRLRSG